MSWTFVGKGTLVTDSTTAAHTLVEPAGVQQGDLLIACISSRIASATAVTLPTGGEWTLITQQNNNNVLTSTSAQATGTMAFCIRGASAPNYTFTHPAVPSVALGRVVAYRGQAASTPKDTQVSTTTATVVTSISVTGLTTAQANELIVAMIASGQESTKTVFDATDPSTSSGSNSNQVANPIIGTWQERTDDVTSTGADTGLSIFDAVRGTAGATGNFTATASQGSGHSVLAVAFKMAPTAHSGAATLAGAGSMSAAERQLLRAAMVATGSGGLTADATKSGVPTAWDGSAVLAGVGGLLANARKVIDAVTLAGVGGVDIVATGGVATTIYDNAFTTASNGQGDANVNFRTWIAAAQLGAATGDQIRVTFQYGSDSGSFATGVDDMYVGRHNTANNNTTYTGNQVRVTFSGSNSFASSAGGQYVSDWVALGEAYSNAFPYQVTFHSNTAASTVSFGSFAPGGSEQAAFSYTSGASTSANTTGGAPNGWQVWSIRKLEIRSSASGPAYVTQSMAARATFGGTGGLDADAVIGGQPTVWDGAANLGGVGGIIAPTKQTMLVTASFGGIGGITVNARGPLTAGTPELVWYASSTSNHWNYDAAEGDNYKLRAINPTKQGNCLVLKICYPNGSTPTITDDNGNSWGAAVATADGGAGNLITKIYVLPDARAGQTTINVAFGVNTHPFFYDYSEWCNVSPDSPVAGTHVAAYQTGSALAAGSFTPSDNDALGGNLILAFFDSASLLGGAVPTSWVVGTNFTLLSADRVAVGASSGYPHSAEYYVQTTAAAINPGATASGSTTTRYNCVAVALKGASYGSPKGAGIHIDKILQLSIVQPGTSWACQLPAGGNLWVMESCMGAEWTDVKDNVGDNVSWSNIEAGNWTALRYRDGRSAKNDMVVTITQPGSGPTNSIRFYDISGAAASNALDVSAITSSTIDVSNQTNVSNAPSITPTSDGIGGICIAGASIGLGPGYGFYTGAPANAVWDLPNYDNQFDDCTMTNSDASAHCYVTDTTTLHWNYTIKSSPGNSVLGVAAVFKTASGTAWDVSGSLAGAGGMVLQVSAVLSGFAIFSGAGGLSANALKLINAMTLTGVGGLTAPASQRVVTSGLFAGVGGLLSTAVKVINALTLAGVGGQTSVATQRMLAAAALAGTGGLAVDLTPLGTQAWAGEATLAGVGGLSATAIKLINALTLAGVGGQTSAATQRMLVSATPAGIGGLSATALKIINALTLAGVGGQASIATQRMLASAAFAGVGSLTAEATKAGAVTAWDGSATFAGVGALLASTSQRLQVSSTEAGVGALIVQTLQAHAARATLAGVGGLTGTAIKLINALSLSGVGALAMRANVFIIHGIPTPDQIGVMHGVGGMSATALKIINALTLAGVGGLTTQTSQRWTFSQTFAGVGALFAELTSPGAQVYAISAALGGVGGLSANVGYKLLGAQSFAGVGALLVSTTQLETARAAFAGVGQLAASAQKIINALTFAGVGGGFTTVLRQRMDTDAPLGGVGSLTAQTTQKWIVSQAFAGVGGLSASLTPPGAQTYQVTATLAGVGGMSATARKVIDALKFTGVGGVIVNTRQRMDVRGTLGGVGGLSVLAGIASNIIIPQADLRFSTLPPGLAPGVFFWIDAAQLTLSASAASAVIAKVHHWRRPISLSGSVEPDVAIHGSTGQTTNLHGTVEHDKVLLGD